MRLLQRSSFLVACLVAGASLLASGSGFDPHLLHHLEQARSQAASIPADHNHSAAGLETAAPSTHSPLCILCASRHASAATSVPAPQATPPVARAAAAPLPTRLARDFEVAGPGSPRAPPVTLPPA